MHRNYSEHITGKLSPYEIGELGELDSHNITFLGNDWYSTPTRYFDKWDTFRCDTFPGRVFQVEEAISNRFRVITNVRLEGSIKLSGHKFPVTLTNKYE